MRCLLLTWVLLAGACSERQLPEPVPQQIRPVKLMTVAGNQASAIHSFTARVEALQLVDLSFEVGGPLQALNVREGERVPVGHVVATLDPTEYQLAVQEAEVQLKLARQDLERKRRVLSRNAIAKSEVDDALTNYELQQVRLRKAKEQLHDSRLLAPFDAYVAKRFVDSFVNLPPGTPVVRLADVNQLLVVISVPEKLVATVSAEQVVRAWTEFSFAPGRQFALTYHENRGEADALAQTYEVSFVMPAPGDLNILPGMTATAFVDLGSADGGQVLLPASALVPDAADGFFVWLFDAKTGDVVRRPVATRAPTNDGIPVVHGLNPGDQVVVAGAGQLQAGMRVRPLE